MKAVSVAVVLSVLCLVQGLPSRRPLPSLSSTRIVGGEDAEVGEFPHQIQLQLFGGHYCGGSIIDELHIVTAGHCVTLPASFYTVVAGQHDLSSTEGTEQAITVAEIIVHENYGVGPGFTPNDIAILRLSSPLSFNANVAPIALPEAVEGPGNLIVSGWGATSGGGPTPDILQKLEEPLASDDDCFAAWGDSLIPETMVCFGTGIGDTSACSGDSGGPLIANGANGAHLVGIVSWGHRDCAVPGFYSVFTEVAAYVDWINEAVGN